MYAVHLFIYLFFKGGREVQNKINKSENKITNMKKTKQK